MNYIRQSMLEKTRRTVNSREDVPRYANAEETEYGWTYNPERPDVTTLLKDLDAKEIFRQAQNQADTLDDLLVEIRDLVDSEIINLLEDSDMSMGFDMMNSIGHQIGKAAMQFVQERVREGTYDSATASEFRQYVRDSAYVRA